MLQDLIVDKRYLNHKLYLNDLNKIKQTFNVPGASFATFVNRYDSLREKYTGFVCENVDCHNLVPDAAVDWWHAQLVINTGSGTRGSNFVAVSASTSTPLDTWTTLASEITTGGLARAVSSPAAAHVAGTNVSVVEKTFTASATHTGVRLVGLFNASSGGILNHVGQLDKVQTVPNGSQYRVLCTLTFP